MWLWGQKDQNPLGFSRGFGIIFSPFTKPGLFGVPSIFDFPEVLARTKDFLESFLRVLPGLSPVLGTGCFPLTNFRAFWGTSTQYF